MVSHTINPDDAPYDPESLPVKDECGTDGFVAVDMRVGRIVDVAPFPEARKPAWKIFVDFGPVIGTLQSSAQITNYSEADLQGRLVVGAVNLGRKRIAGFESQFLVLGALEPDGTVLLLAPDGDPPLGAPIA